MITQVKEEKGTPQQPSKETADTPQAASAGSLSTEDSAKEHSAMFIAYKFITRKRALTEETVKRSASDGGSDRRPLAKRPRKRGGRSDTYDRDGDDRDDDSSTSSTLSNSSSSNNNANHHHHNFKEEDWEDDDISGRRGTQSRRRQDRQRGSNASINQETTRCVCGKKDEEGTMIQCERCLVWQHMHCMGLTSPLPPKRKYFCELCRPRDVKCLCNSTNTNGKFVQCTKCGKFQHSVCTGVFVKPFSSGGDDSTRNYTCHNCTAERTHNHHPHHNSLTTTTATTSSSASSTPPPGATTSSGTAQGTQQNATTTTTAASAAGNEGEQEKLVESAGKNRSVSPSPRKGKKSVSIASTIFAYVSSSWVRNELTEDWNAQPWLATNKIHRQKKRKTIIPISTAYEMSLIQKYLIRLVSRRDTGANILPNAGETAISIGENEMIVKGLSTYLNCNEAAVLDTFSVLVAPYAPASELIPAAPVAATSPPPTDSKPNAAETVDGKTVKKEPFTYSERTIYPSEVVSAIPDIEISSFPGILTSVQSGELRKTERIKETDAGITASESLKKGSFVCEVCGTVADPRKIDEEIASQNSEFNSPLIDDASAYDSVLFYPPYPQCVLCIDARTTGNAARKVRRSCTPNSEFRAFVAAGNGGNGDEYVRVGLFALADVDPGTELTVAFDYCWKALAKMPQCPCGKGPEGCEVEKWFSMRDRAFAAAYSCVQKLIYIDPPVRPVGGGAAKGNVGGGAPTSSASVPPSLQSSASPMTASAGAGGSGSGGGTAGSGGKGKAGKELEENTQKKGKKRQAFAVLSTPEWAESREAVSSREDRKIRQIEETFRRMESREQKKKRGLTHGQQTKKQRRRGGDDTSPSDSSGSSASSPSLTK